MRNVDTLRVSVTDRCNLRCGYCMPPEGAVLMDHRDILSFEEIERVARVAATAGVTKVRLTGGEPLVRKDIEVLVEKLKAVPGVADLPMTTNGVLLERKAPSLKAAGLSRVTVSLDTLRPDRFETVTGRPRLDRVLAGIDAAIAQGLAPLKVNVVVVPGVNDDEILDFARLAADRSIEARFIERMPLSIRGPRCGQVSREYVPSARLKETIEAETGRLEPAGGARGPARVFDIPGGRGRIGFISAMSEPFCRWCSRMRLTADGKLLACLADPAELDLKGPLRAGADDAELAGVWREAVARKPYKEAACFTSEGRLMSQIGG